MKRILRVIVWIFYLFKLLDNNCFKLATEQTQSITLSVAQWVLFSQNQIGLSVRKLFRLERHEAQKVEKFYGANGCKNRCNLDDVSQRWWMISPWIQSLCVETSSKKEDRFLCLLWLISHLLLRRHLFPIYGRPFRAPLKFYNNRKQYTNRRFWMFSILMKVCQAERH